MNQAVSTRARKAPRLSSIILMLLVGVFLLALWQREAIYDWNRLRNYTPAPTVAQLATDTTMTDYARHMYYINQPALKDRSVFSSFCDVKAEQSVVLGCYKSGQQGIYLLKVTNAELAGIQQVTAAHEMLHAVYERLDESEKEKVNTALQHYYQVELTDQNIKDIMNEYKKTEPDNLVEEMYAIFGTQVVKLPVELEEHYKQYFTERGKVTSYYESYREAFLKRQRQIKQSDEQLDVLKTQIDQLETEVKVEQADIQNRRTTLNQYRANGNAEAYNDGVDGFNAVVARYNADVARLQSLITQFNELVKQRNDIAFQERQLVESLSTSGIKRQ